MNGFFNGKERLMKLGIMGSGDIVSSMLRLFKALDAYQCKALFCRKVSEHRGQELVKKYDIAKLYTDMDAFLMNDSFDTVYVAVINNYHYDYCKKAIIAGKNVICEKPFTVTYEQAKELIELADRHHVMIYELCRNVLTNNYASIKEHLAKIGKVSMIDASLCHYSRRYDDYKKGVIAPVFDASKAGGSLYDFGIYALHFIIGLFGEPHDVSYEAINGEDGVDLAGCLILRYTDMIANVSLSKIANAPAYFCIQGEDGYISSNSSVMYIKEVTLSQHGNIQTIAKDDPNNIFEELIMVEKMFTSKDHGKLAKCLHDTLICIKVIDQIKRRGLNEDKANIDK